MMSDLGTFPGGSDSYAWGINNNGQVVGAALTASGDQHAFLYNGGMMIDLGTLGGSVSEAACINDRGQVAGDSDTASGLPAGGLAFLYSGGVMSDLGTLPFGSDSQAFGINNSGQVVGRAFAGGAYHAFLYSGGVMHDLGTLGGTWTQAAGINNSGQVVGFSNTLGNQAQHAFLYSGGVMIDLGSLGGSISQASAITESSQIVGASWTAGNSAEHAFVYAGGVMSDLNNDIGSSSGWTLQDALGINDNGQIVGYGTNPSGQIDAFLLTPIPEPGVPALLLVVGATILFRRGGKHGPKKVD
jgi:probable HAF family extracellular repeat protein